MKPIIGVSGGHIMDQGGRFPGYKRSYVNDNYIQSVVAAGGVPHIIPVVYEEDVIKQQAELIDALILSGGDDVNPLMYGEEPLTKLGGIFPERDKFDSTLLNYVLEQHKPVFAICRGIQIMNVTFGGSLWQDLSYNKVSSIKHDQYYRSDLPTHSVTVEKESHLHELLGDTVLTNSFHHQAIKDVAPGFKVIARAKDGVIEAIQKEGNDYCVAVQWHPEMMAATSPAMLSLFEKLVTEASTRKLVNF